MRTNFMSRTTVSLVAVLLVGTGCAKDSPPTPPPAPATPTHVEADGLGSDRAGDKSLQTQSPDGAWIAYNEKMTDNDSIYSLILRGPNGFQKTLAVGETLWPESFSPDGKLFLYVHNAKLSPSRDATSLFVYTLASGETKQVTNQDPNLPSLSNEEFDRQHVASPLSGVTWNGHIITYTTRAYKNGLELVTIHLDTGEMSRSPLSN